MCIVKSIIKPDDTNDLSRKEDEQDVGIVRARFITECGEENVRNFENFMRAHNITDYDSKVIEELSNIRRPLILFRGRPVTVEQTKMLITGLEPLFREPDEKQRYDIRRETGLLGDIFYRQKYNGLDSWLHSDGVIGANWVSANKYPEFDELIMPMELGKEYPFLDMCISYTNYNEYPCFWCMGLEKRHKDAAQKCKCRDCAPYLDLIEKYDIYHRKNNHESEFEELYFRSWDTHIPSDIGDNVRLTVWVHDGRTDILFGDKAAKKFNEYNTLYCSPEYDFMFGYGIYSYGETCICDKEFVESCFAYIGKPKETCDEYVEQGILLPFNDEIVVTKEWVTQQYRDYIRGSESKRED